MDFDRQDQRRPPRFLKYIIGLLGLALAAATATTAADTSVQARLAYRSLLLDVARADGRLVAVGDRGHVLVSTDGGQSWEQKAVPTRALLTSVFFLDKQRGWAAGHDQTILVTVDGGQTWQLQHEDTTEDRPLFDLWFTDADHGIAVGAYALYLVTEDGGRSWEPASFTHRLTGPAGEEGGEAASDADQEDVEEFDFHLHRFTASDSGTLYLAAEAGYVFRSRDRGKTWLRLPLPYEGSFFGVTALAGDSVLVYGLRSHMFRSDDEGETWVEVNFGTQALLDCGVRLANGSVVVAGLGGVVLVSDDEGRSFSLWQQKDGKGLSALLEVAPGRLVATGEAGAKILNLEDFRQGS